mmetsp:Transcript_20566/g.44973  ORF Transcript_20566/g.44973 Transcript_20566/m.44973 type:complete len:219 (-) Transcript_20566:884-1540(-)
METPAFGDKLLKPMEERAPDDRALSSVSVLSTLCPRITSESRSIIRLTFSGDFDFRSEVIVRGLIVESGCRDGIRGGRRRRPVCATSMTSSTVRCLSTASKSDTIVCGLKVRSRTDFRLVEPTVTIDGKSFDSLLSPCLTAPQLVARLTVALVPRTSGMLAFWKQARSCTAFWNSKLGAFCASRSRRTRRLLFISLCMRGIGRSLASSPKGISISIAM